MGLFTRVLNWLSEIRGIRPRDPALADLFGAGQTSGAGIVVTEDTALTLCPVYACVDVISSAIASLPLEIHKRLRPRGQELADRHPLWSILHDAPNPEMTSYTWRAMMQTHLLLRGNAFCYVVRNGSGRVAEIWPLRPDRVNITREGGELVYYVSSGGSLTDPSVPHYKLFSDEILHLKGLSGDGVLGYSPIRAAREAMGLALAAEQFGARHFGNGSRPGGVLIHPGALSEEASTRLKRSWEEAHRGISNSNRVAILEEGMKFEKIAVTPEDSQFLETRVFQLREIARLFRVPPHMIGDIENASYATVEQQSLDFVKHCLRPWLYNWEQELSRQILTQADRSAGYSPRHSLVDLLRGDTASRVSYYESGRQWGWLSIDEVRDHEGLNPLPDGRGEGYLEPLNMKNVMDDEAPEPETEPIPLPLVSATPEDILVPEESDEGDVTVAA